MNRAQKFGFVAMALGVIAPVVLDYISFKHMTYRAKPVDAELLKEQAADRFAKAVVRETIQNGSGYTDRRIDPAEDFEFFRIAYHIEN